MRNSLILVLFFLNQTLVFSQIIEGSVSQLKNKELSPIEFANVLIKGADQNSIISYGITNEEGFFSIDLNKIDKELILGPIFIEANSYGYQGKTFSLIFESNTTKYLRDFVLSRDVEELKTVIIKSKPRAVNIKKDTTIYSAEKFKDGSESTVEDLLKKLPGIAVDSDGAIKFKGTPISKVLIEGDDLFDSNYTIGTKNISIDLIDKIQAIEKWSENPLLKGIESTDKVALNLKLKKGLTNVSGDFFLGLGIKDRYEIDLSGLLIEKRVKNFTAINYYTTGINKSPYKFSTFGKSPRQIENLEFQSRGIISEFFVTNGVNSQRASSNNNFFASTNQTIKLSNNFSLRLNLNYNRDRLELTSQRFTNFLLSDSEDLNISEVEEISKLPEIVDFDINAIWNSSKKTSIEFNSEFVSSSANTIRSILSNETNNFSSNLESKNILFKQNIIHTSKLNNQSAIQMKAHYSVNSLPQEFSISPSLDFSNGIVLDDGLIFQKVDNRKELLFINGLYLVSNKNDSKFQLVSEIKLENDKLESKLFRNNSLEEDDFQNNIALNSRTILLGASYDWKLGKFRVNPKLDLRSHGIEFVDIQIGESILKDKLVVNPYLNIFYNLSKSSRFSLGQSYNETPREIYNLYDGLVLTSFRDLRNNDINLRFKKSYQNRLSYRYSDLYNQFDMEFGLTYLREKNNIFSNTLVRQNLTQTNIFILPEFNDNFNIDYKIEKYLPFLSLTTSLSAYYSINRYKSIFNNSSIRDNTLNNSILNFYFKTAFDFPVNFQNTLRYNRSKIITDEIDATQNSGLVNNFQILFNHDKRWFASFSFDYLNFSLENPSPNTFLDFNLRYITKKGKAQFSLIFSNLNNNRSFQQRSISDLAVFENSQSLNQRYLLLKMKFKI